MSPYWTSEDLEILDLVYRLPDGSHDWSSSCGDWRDGIRMSELGKLAGVPPAYREVLLALGELGS